jgi:hypothetical protein
MSMKVLVVGAKKRHGEWEGALITDGELTQVEKPMDVAEFVGTVISAALGDEEQITVEIMIGKKQKS